MVPSVALQSSVLASGADSRLNTRLRTKHVARLSAPARFRNHAPAISVGVARAAAGTDSEESGQGRLVRDALEFTRPSTDGVLQQAEQNAADTLRDYKPGQLLGGKYKVIEKLGRGNAGVTYKAEQPGGGLIAVKTLSLRTMQGDWKQLELFEKETNTLRSLSHTSIPAYKDYFEVDSDGDRAYFLVQELAEGKSLAQMVEAGWRPAQKEVERIADELLSTLAYLQSQKIVHRDVKPENVVLEGGKPGGKVFLVDFGGVQQGNRDVADSEVLDTGTLVGTYGYMAPEQLRGAARPASDLHALGGTLLYLLSGEPPSSFPQRRLQVDFSSVDMSPRLRKLLTGLLQPVWEDRLTAAQAKSVLAGTASQQWQHQPRQQQRAWNPFSRDAREDQQKQPGAARQSSQAREEEQEASTSGRFERQGVGINNALLALAAAYLLPGPLFPLAAISLPFLLAGRSGKSRRRSRPAQASGQTAADDAEVDWMSGSQRQQQTGFGFSDGPASADSARDEGELTDEERQALRRRRQQQQMAAFQQQQMLLNMMRMMAMGGGMMSGYRGPFGRRGVLRRGPFMF